MSNEIEQYQGAVPAEYAEQMAEDSGAGLDDYGSGDFALPFINLLQALSPQVQRGDDQVEGAEPGHFYNTVTGQVFDGEEGLRVIPVGYRMVYNEWVPRNQGGGFVDSYGTQEEAIMNAEPENDIVDTANFYVMVQNPDTGMWEQAILSMTSTKLRVSRKWNSMVAMRKFEVDGEKYSLPIFGGVYRLRSVQETNDEGTFFNLRVEPDGFTLEEGQDVYESAKEFRQLVQEGEVGADFRRTEDLRREMADEDLEDPEF